MTAVVVMTEHRLLVAPDGCYYSEGPMGYHFWKRYLAGFQSVDVLARVRPVDDAQGLVPLSGEGVGVLPLTDRRGLFGQFAMLGPTARAIGQLVPGESRLIVRLPSLQGSFATLIASVRGVGFACEVVGDPAAVFSRGVVDHWLRWLIRGTLTASQKWSVRRAFAVAYVTESYLQALYPPSSGSTSVHYSSVELGPDDFGQPVARTSTRLRFCGAGSMDRTYKRFDVLLQAISNLRATGVDAELVLLGDGCHRSSLEAMARELGIAPVVHFAGQISDRSEYRSLMAGCHVFVHASSTEGLPRVVIEAMALGLAVVATDVGGTAELLDSTDLVAPGEVDPLSARMAEFADDRLRMDAGRRNRLRADDYSTVVLAQRRDAFYTAVAR